MKIGEAQPSTPFQELQIALRDAPQPLVGLFLALPAQFLRDIRLPAGEPGGIEHCEIVGVDGGLVALPQGIAGQEHGIGAAMLQRAGAGDDRFQFIVPRPIAINGMEAGRPAGGFIRLGEYLDGKAQFCGQHA